MRALISTPDGATPAEIREVAEPTPAANELVLRVEAASVNRGDYCMVKAGLAMMTKLFADRLASDGINVYEIRPGVIATDMTGGVKEKYDKLIITDERGITPIRRWGKPEDIGRAVRAIAEDRFPFSTGACFDVDGGFHLQRL